jgi:O-6-methylguanine DNA methyltransferase
MFDHGTPFQKEVWQAMLEIPFGKTMSYLEIAKKINRPKAVRAVGQACKRNPIGIVVPCHRVIGSDGSLTGYSGKNFIHVKQKLLDHERRYVK